MSNSPREPTLRIPVELSAGPPSVLFFRFPKGGGAPRRRVSLGHPRRERGTRILADTGSPLGQAVFTIIAAIAQLERSLLVERVKAGLRRARHQGKHIGRPRLRIDSRRLESVVSRRLPSRVAARELGISQSSFLRLVRDDTEQAPSQVDAS